MQLLETEPHHSTASPREPPFNYLARAMAIQSTTEPQTTNIKLRSSILHPASFSTDAVASSSRQAASIYRSIQIRWKLKTRKIQSQSLLSRCQSHMGFKTKKFSQEPEARSSRQKLHGFFSEFNLRV